MRYIILFTLTIFIIGCGAPVLPLRSEHEDDVLISGTVFATTRWMGQTLPFPKLSAIIVSMDELKAQEFHNPTVLIENGKMIPVLRFSPKGKAGEKKAFLAGPVTPGTYALVGFLTKDKMHYYYDTPIHMKVFTVAKGDRIGIINNAAMKLTVPFPPRTYTPFGQLNFIELSQPAETDKELIRTQCTEWKLDPAWFDKPDSIKILKLSPFKAEK